MPLIIAVLVIVVVFLSAKGFNKENNRKQREYTASIRRTNAKLECELVKKYVGDGHCLDEAIELVQKDLSANGYEPCIPKSAYRVSGFNVDVCDKQRFDSAAVKGLREDFHRDTKKAGIDFSTREEFEQKCEEYIYDNLPKTNWQYERYLDLSMKKIEAVDVGRYISYPGLGTCEVIALDYDKLQHTVKVVKTGKITKIAFGDKHIIRL